MPDPKLGITDLSDSVPSGSTISMPMTAGTGQELPEQFGRFQIIRRLGQGGMGSVYLAEDTQLGRKVALKVSDLSGCPDSLKRFEREARALAALDHPSICPVHEYGICNGIPFLVMAYIAGSSLAESIPEGGMPRWQAAALVKDLAVAMQEAHALGILHRDLKPANTMLKPTGAGLVPVIVDFGLARRDNSAEEGLTAIGRAMGTVSYMPLEQLNGDSMAIGPACDIYALGIILYELLTGRRPFQGGYSQIVAQKETHMPIPPRLLRAEIDPRLEAVCLKAMAREIKDRHASMAALADALADFLNEKTEPFSVPNRPLAETLALPGDQSSMPQSREGRPTPLVSVPAARSWGEGEKPVGPSREGLGGGRKNRTAGQARNVLAASFGGLFLLGIVIYIATDKGRFKIDLGDPKGPVKVTVEQDGKKKADVTIEPPAAPVASRPVVPPSPGVSAQQWVSPFTKMKFAVIPAGTFEMGSEDGADHEKPRHGATISRPFCLGVCEVTQGEYERVMGTNPSVFSKTGDGKHLVQDEDTDRLPVETLSWFDAVKCCNELSRKDRLAPFYTIEGEGDSPRVTVPDWNGTGYRLPTEAEWEYACRAGSTTWYGFGDDATTLDGYAWYADDSAGKTHPVGGKLANAWSLHDLHGNLWEWCWDWSGDDYYKSTSSNLDSKGPELGEFRILRGGGWNSTATDLRSAFRHRCAPTGHSHVFGFRMARTYH